MLKVKGQGHWEWERKVKNIRQTKIKMTIGPFYT